MDWGISRGVRGAIGRIASRSREASRDVQRRLRWIPIVSISPSPAAIEPAARPVAHDVDSDADADTMPPAAVAAAGSRHRGVSPSPSVASMLSLVTGDSEVSQPELCELSGDDEDATPSPVTRRERDTAPIFHFETAGASLRSAVLNDREDVGNIGFFFGNFGLRPEEEDSHRKNIDKQIKRQPCQIIGLAECQKTVEELLKRPPKARRRRTTGAAVAGDPDTDEDHPLHSREEHAYMTLRGNEESSVCVAVRVETAESIEHLEWDRTYHKDYPCGQTTRKAYSRLLVASIRLHNNVGYIGKDLRVAVCHLHHHVANKVSGFRQENDKYWPRLADYMHKHRVHVLMGDFNMSLWKVVPELRSRGVPAHLAAWYPWLTETGAPAADSCGIFMLMDKVCLTHRVSSNIFVEERLRRLLDVHRMKASKGEKASPPGQEMKTYLPKMGNLLDKLNDSLKPQEVQRRRRESWPAVADEGEDERGETMKGEGKGKRRPDCLNIKEKRLLLEVCSYNHEGTLKRGTHFPLAVFTNNVGRRGEANFVRRRHDRSAGWHDRSAGSRGHGWWDDRSGGWSSWADRHSADILHAMAGRDARGSEESWDDRSGGRSDHRRGGRRDGRSGGLPSEGSWDDWDDRSASRKDDCSGTTREQYGQNAWNSEWDQRGQR